MVGSSGPVVRELPLFLIIELSRGHSLISLHLTIRVDRSLEWGTEEVTFF